MIQSSSVRQHKVLRFKRLDVIDGMEAKLAQYRAKREKEKKSGLFKNFFGTKTLKSESKDSDESPRTSHSILTEVERRSLAERDYERRGTSDWALRNYVSVGLKVALWLCLWKFFVEIGFGAVYFIVSVSYVMYKNTRTGPREPSTLSAYSVFNPNQERLDGTFTTEQFEKELRLGPSSVR